MLFGFILLGTKFSIVCNYFWSKTHTPHILGAKPTRGALNASKVVFPFPGRHKLSWHSHM